MIFFLVMTFFSCYTTKFVSMKNKECKVRPEKISINSYEPLFYPHSILESKCNGSCNAINNSYAKLCIHDFMKT